MRRKGERRKRRRRDKKGRRREGGGEVGEGVGGRSRTLSRGKEGEDRGE